VSVSDTFPPVGAANSAKRIAVASIVIAFVAGVLAGIVGDRVWMLRHVRPRGMRSMTARIVKRLDHDLSLTPQQRDQVTRILEQHQQRVAAITAISRPQIRREIDMGNAEIERILTPEQRAKFQTIRMRMRREGPPPGRP
jgi:Spy/CpxP family protein refolding chaperone